MQHNVEQNHTCSVCGLALLPDESVCPCCGIPVKDEDRNRMPIIHLDHLDRIDQLIWDDYHSNSTELQMIKILAANGLSIEDHMIYGMVIDADNQSPYVHCNHPNHDTPEKQAACLKKEAAKFTVRTIRHHMGFLDRFQIWSDMPDAEIIGAMWTCIERHHPACPLCLNREGMIIPISARFVTILHPGCNCSLVPIEKRFAYQNRIQPAISYLEERSPQRAATMRRNLARSGFDCNTEETNKPSPQPPTEGRGTKAPSSKTGCMCVLISVIIITLSLARVFL